MTQAAYTVVWSGDVSGTEVWDLRQNLYTPGQHSTRAEGCLDRGHTKMKTLAPNAGKVVTPAEIAQQRDALIAKAKIRAKEIEEQCRKHYAKIATGVYGESNTRTPDPEVKVAPVVAVHVETKSTKYPVRLRGAPSSESRLTKSCSGVTSDRWTPLTVRLRASYCENFPSFS